MRCAASIGCHPNISALNAYVRALRSTHAQSLPAHTYGLSRKRIPAMVSKQSQTSSFKIDKSTGKRSCGVVSPRLMLGWPFLPGTDLGKCSPHVQQRVMASRAVIAHSERLLQSYRPEGVPSTLRGRRESSIDALTERNTMLNSQASRMDSNPSRTAASSVPGGAGLSDSITQFSVPHRVLFDTSAAPARYSPSKFLVPDPQEPLRGYGKAVSCLTMPGCDRMCRCRLPKLDDGLPLGVKTAMAVISTPRTVQVRLWAAAHTVEHSLSHHLNSPVAHKRLA